MKRKITITVCLLLLSVGVFAQSSTTMQKLINKEWVYIFTNPEAYIDHAWKEIFTTAERITTILVKGYPTSGAADFHLSDQIETTFDYGKVGNVQNGKYIIQYIPDLRGETIFSVYEIITLTDTYLEIKSLKSGFIFRYNAANPPVEYPPLNPPTNPKPPTEDQEPEFTLS